MSISDYIFVIPARSGSVGVPNKNIKILGGKSLIQRAVDCVLSFNMKSRVVVNSDSSSYLNSIKGNVIKFQRTEKNGRSDSLMIEVLQEMDEKLESFRSSKFIVIIQPTCPFRQPSQIRNAVKVIENNNFDSVISVTKMDDFHPARMYKVRGNRLESLDPNLESDNRQKLPTVYHRNGLIYLLKREVFLKGKIIGTNVGYIEVDKSLALNIDDDHDWNIAEKFF